MDTQGQLQRLRDEFIKRSKNPEAIWRVEHTEEMQTLPAVTFQQADFTDGPNGHEYVMTIKVNLYARPEEIEKAFTTDIMKRIKFNQYLLHIDNPESKRPNFQTGRGKRLPEKQIKEISTCLAVFDMYAQGKSTDYIVRRIYKNTRRTDRQIDAYESDCVKVIQKKRKALKLIEAVKSGIFPDIA